MVRGSGQRGVGADAKPRWGMATRARLVLENPSKVRVEAGATMADAVAQDFVQAKDEFIAQDLPAWRAAGMPQLTGTELPVLIRAVGVIGVRSSLTSSDENLYQ